MCCFDGRTGGIGTPELDGILFEKPLQFINRSVQHGMPEAGAHRGPDHFRVPQIHSPWKRDRGIYAKCGCCAENGPNVTGVLYRVEHKDTEWCLAREFVEAMGRNLTNRQHALGGLGFRSTPELSLCNRDRFQPRLGDPRPELRAALRPVELGRDEDATHLHRRAQKLFQGPYSLGYEQGLPLPGFAATEIPRESEEFQSGRGIINGIGLAFRSRKQSTVGAKMKRIIAPLALTMSLAACGISQQQEVQMGQDYAQQINSQLPIVSDPEANRYINVLGDQIAARTSRADLDWRFYIVDSKEVNAFAVPGGFIYVNRGLIERTTRMDELAGVLGHEIGHVVRRHSIEQMEKAQGANVGVTLACVLTSICNSGVAQAGINIAGGAIFARFSRQDELEADQEAVANTVRAGISPQGIVTMFQTLMQERRSRPSSVESWFATHPLEEDRIAAAQASINSIPASQRNSLTANSNNYTSFVRRIRSLPAPRQ